MAKKESVKRVNVNLPNEMIMEILLKLPVKTLSCCKCVCKSWLSLISNPSFATLHFEHAATRRFVFISGSDPQPLFLDVDAWVYDDPAYASSSIDFIRSLRFLEVRGSCRGFLFLYNAKNIYLLNPSTGLIKQIQDSPLIRNDGVELLSGFAYYQPTDDYLIVSGFCEIHPNLTRSFTLMFFSLRANEWKSIELASHLSYKPTCILEFAPKRGLFLNGSIHWMVYNSETSKKKSVIIAFDLKEVTISEIALPDDFIFGYSKKFSINYDLLEVGGLMGACLKDQNTVKMWVMQKYGVHSSWTKIIEFRVDPELNTLELVCLTKCGDIVLTNWKGELLKFNDKGQLQKSILAKGYELMFAYKESLFSLPAPDKT